MPSSWCVSAWKGLGTVGISVTSASARWRLALAPVRKSRSTSSCPVTKLSMTSWAESPRATSTGSISWVVPASTPYILTASGTSSMSTCTRVSVVFGSNPQRDGLHLAHVHPTVGHGRAEPQACHGARKVADDRDALAQQHAAAEEQDGGDRDHERTEHEGSHQRGAGLVHGAPPAAAAA
jgi:hypothetical protein